LGLTAVVIAVTAVFFGSLPAARTLRIREIDALRSSSPTVSASRGHLRSRRNFVAAQISLSLILLVRAGLLISTFMKILSEPLGFQTRGTFVGEVAVPYAAYPKLA